MWALRIHFFLTYAILGGVLPVFSVYLKQVQGLSAIQIGTVMAVASISVLVTPILFTWLADIHQNTRRLAAGLYLTSAVAMGILLFSQGFWPTVLLFALHSLAMVPMLPLQDGLYFTVARAREEEGLPTPPFHRIRVWGTVGFIAPSLFLFGFLRGGSSLEITLISAVICSLAGLINTFFLPEPAIPDRIKAPSGQPSRLPTAAAARVLFSYPAVLFCAGMALLQFAVAGYYSFYPLLLSDVVGFDREWLGPVSNIGVSVEIFFMLGFGWLCERFGIRRIMIFGALAITLRMAALAFFPTAAVAIGVQFFHGAIIMGTIVAPVVYLNRLAGDRFRNSIQGLYTMVIAGLFRILGNLFFGRVAETSLTSVFLYGSILALIGSLLFMVAFRDTPEKDG